MANWVKVTPDGAETTFLNLELVAAVRMWDSVEMATIEFTGELRSTDQGFDEWYGIPNSSDEAYWPDSMMFDPDSNPFATPEYVMEGRKGEQPKSVKVYNTNERRLIDRELTDKAIDFMKRKANAGKPFFAFIPYTQPHHHWKMIVKEIDNGLDATREYGVPRIYNLLLDPKEEHWLNYGPENAWVRWPLAQVLADHALSLRFSAHTPRRDGLSRAEERGPRRSKADARRHGLRQRRRPRRHHRSAVARP